MNWLLFEICNKIYNEKLKTIESIVKNETYATNNRTNEICNRIL